MISTSDKGCNFIRGKSLKFCQNWDILQEFFKNITVILINLLLVFEICKTPLDESFCRVHNTKSAFAAYKMKAKHQINDLINERGEKSNASQGWSHSLKGAGVQTGKRYNLCLTAYWFFTSSYFMLQTFFFFNFKQQLIFK